MEWLDAAWIWFGVGLALIILELLTGSLFLIWISFGALIVAAVLYFEPGLAIHWQLILFAVTAVTSTYLGRTYLRGLFGREASDRPMLNRRGEQLVGRTVWAIENFAKSDGRVRLGDTQWNARLRPLQSGLAPPVIAKDDALVIVAVEGATLIVDPA